MWEWLLAPIDANRTHEVSFAVAWHGRVMVLAWAILAPLAILAARYLKVLPWQDWPRHLDNQLWWRTHWIGQSFVALLSIIGFGLICTVSSQTSWHGRLGYSVLALTILQISLGIFRGSKGGPTAPAPDGSPRGDHYDMTRWRLMFEFIHKSVGYLLLTLAIVTMLFGLWSANAPRWMWGAITFWWSGLALFAIWLQSQGWAMETYQAIWGPGREHPGNRRQPQGWGTRRVSKD